jgi:hypothetical protein
MKDEGLCTLGPLEVDTGSARCEGAESDLKTELIVIRALQRSLRESSKHMDELRLYVLRISGAVP